MRSQLVFDLLTALVNKNAGNIESAFKTIINDSKSTRETMQLTYIFDKYHQSAGITQNLPQELRPFVFMTNRKVTIKELTISADIWELTKEISKEWKIREVLRDNGLSNINRILLAGSPGNGKTSFALAMSDILHITPYVINTGRIFSSGLGDSEKNIDHIFKNVPAPSILFFDEFDAIGEQRESSGETCRRAYNSVVSSILLEMDRLNKDIIMIAATNRIELLDPGIIRRFDIIQNFPEPTGTEKYNYCDSYCNRHQCSLDYLDQVDCCKSYSDLEHMMMRLHKSRLIKEMDGDIND